MLNMITLIDSLEVTTKLLGFDLKSILPDKEHKKEHDTETEINYSILEQMEDVHDFNDYGLTDVYAIPSLSHR
jgi:hypothetical protein